MEVYENTQSSKMLNKTNILQKKLFFLKVSWSTLFDSGPLKCCSPPGFINPPLLIDHRSFAHFPSQPLLFSFIQGSPGFTPIRPVLETLHHNGRS